MKKIYKPTNNYPAFYQQYMTCVPGDGNLIHHLNDIQIETEELIGNL